MQSNAFFNSIMATLTARPFSIRLNEACLPTCLWPGCCLATSSTLLICVSPSSNACSNRLRRKQTNLPVSSLASCETYPHPHPHPHLVLRILVSLQQRGDIQRSHMFPSRNQSLCSLPLDKLFRFFSTLNK